MKKSWLFFLVIARMELILCAALGATVAYVEPPLVESELSIDGVRIDGSLNLTLDLGVWKLGVHDEIPFHLVHRVRTDSSGHTVSDLTVTGLNAFAVPVGRTGIRCVFPGEIEAKFMANDLGPAFSRAGAGLLVRRSAPNRLEVKTAAGWDWLFEDGLLNAAAGPDLLRLTVETQGAKLTKLRASRLGGTVGELRAQYDSGGNLKEFEFGRILHRFRYAGALHQISEWTSIIDGREKRTQFEYRNDMLVKVTQDNVIQLELTWATIDGGLAADTEWPAPIRVSSLGNTDFFYDLDYKGYHMRAENKETGTMQMRILNPGKGSIDEIEKTKFYRRIFFGVTRSQSNAGQVIRIEDASHSVIGEYEYDSLGRVSAYVTGSGPTRKRTEFVYDEKGRHEKSDRMSLP